MLTRKKQMVEMISTLYYGGLKMETVATVLKTISAVIGGYGAFRVVWGLIILGGGIKDQTAPDIKQGIGEIAGGALIVLVAAIILTIKFQ